MNDMIFILVCDDTDHCGGSFTILKASFDQAALEKEAAVLNVEHNRLRDLFVKVLKEAQRRTERGGNFYEHQSAAINEFVPEADRRRVSASDFGNFYTVTQTPLIHHGTERTKTGSSPDDTQ